MIWDEANDEYVLSTGKRFYANGGILGTADGMGVSEGYDSKFGQKEDFTPEERREMADFMIGLWQNWAE